MSVKKYSVLIVLGVFLGSGIAFAIHSITKESSPTRNIASSKMARLNPRGPVGKVGAPLLVQISALPESDPESGYYKLLARVTLNRPIGSLRFQWALPVESRLIDGTSDGSIVLAAGEDFAEEVIELQLTDTHRDSQILFDVSYEQGGLLMGTSDLFVFRGTSLY
jgi:hypothetical protein